VVRVRQNGKDEGVRWNAGGGRAGGAGGTIGRGSCLRRVQMGRGGAGGAANPNAGHDGCRVGTVVVLERRQQQGNHGRAREGGAADPREPATKSHVAKI
jgi:hypothetical protein